MNPEQHGRILLDLARGVARPDGGLDEALARVAEASAGVIGAARVAIWLFDPDRTRIVCTDLFDHTGGCHESGATIEVRDAPAYFAALSSERIVAAEDAASDLRTCELSETYLGPNGIGALLDAPIFHAGELAGVVCHEHVGGPRIWTVEDRSFAASIGDLVGIALAEHERRETAATLEQSERRFRLLAENTTDMVTDLDANGTLLYASPSHRDGIGYEPEELVGTNAFDRVHPEDAETVIRTIQGGFDAVSSGEALFRYRHKAGHWVWAEGRGRVYEAKDGSLRAVVTTRDVTARVEAEASASELRAQLSQMQRLEAVGRLAGGIAHEFNNQLTAMLGHLAAAEAGEAAGQPIAAELTEIDSVVRRAAGLTQQLLSLGRSQAITPQSVDVGGAIASLTRVIRRVIGEDIAVEVDPDPKTPNVLIDPIQLDQLLMNLVINCRDAMPGGGRLSVRTRSERLPCEATHDLLGGQTEPYARIDVTDTGIGMDAAVRERAFDPFFTTKPAGEGTGLGLSTAYQVVRQAGGTIELQSEEGHGTTVTIHLPALDEPTAVTTPTPARTAAASDLAGIERILLVEDEAYVRRPVEIAMARHGYEVVTANDGREALDRIAACNGDIDLVVSDMVMPVMGGLQLARAIARDHPGVRVLLVSGYAPPTDDRDEPLPVDGILQKPFTIRQLLGAIRDLLEAPASRR